VSSGFQISLPVFGLGFDHWVIAKGLFAHHRKGLPSSVMGSVFHSPPALLTSRTSRASALNIRHSQHTQPQTPSESTLPTAHKC